MTKEWQLVVFYRIWWREINRNVVAVVVVVVEENNRNVVAVVVVVLG